MTSMLIIVASGPENPTRGALALLLAKTALAEGHEVTVFLAGDGTDFLRAETRETAHGVGTGSIAEHWQALTSGGARIFASAMSSKARAITQADGVEFARPESLVELIASCDRVVTY